MDDQAVQTKGWYDRWYKRLFIIPLVLFIISISYLTYFYNEHGDIMYKDSSLAGGTTITLNMPQVDRAALAASLEEEFPDVSVREIRDVVSSTRIALIIDTTAQPEQLIQKIEMYLGIDLNEDNSSVEFSGSSLSQSFYKQLLIAILISFILISIVVFFLFRTVVRSVAIVIAVVGNILMPLALINFFGVRLSAAGIAAFLMLIGYSVDTDILLTTRVLKRKEGTVNERIYGAWKTGLFITGTALAAIVPAFFIVTGLPESFRQIFLILGLGLMADIINTWLMNAAVLKWYVERSL